MDKFDKSLSEIFKKEIKYSNVYEYTVNSTLNNIEEFAQNVEYDVFNDVKRKPKVKLRTIISIAACIILSVGIIKSKNIAEILYAKYEEQRNVEIAATGITAKFENDFVVSSAQINDLRNDSALTQDSIKIAVNEITMDDNLLRVIFDIDLAEEINKNIKYNPEDFYYADIKFEDLMITDEYENILYSADINSAIEKLNIGGDDRRDILRDQLECELEKNEKYFSGNEEYFINSYKDGNVELIYELNLVGLDNYYPRSKSLNFDISKIGIITEKYTDREEEFKYIGNWNLKIDIPENVYSRNRVLYKEISNNIGEENETLKFDVFQSCSEVQLSLKTIDRASLNPAPCATLLNSLEIGEPSTQLRDWFVDLFRASDEFKKYEDDLLRSYLISGNKFENYEGKTIVGPYLENEKGQKFGLNIGPYSNGGGNFTEDNFYQPSFCFELKQEHMTNKLTLHFIYLDKEYVFEYEKESEV